MLRNAQRGFVVFRDFDNHDVYFDLNGKPLHGCAQFNLKDGSTPAQIYDSDHTPISNPQLLDAYGKTGQQVFVNADVRAFFYQYVGEGPMASVIEEDGIDVSDEATWRLLYTVESAAIDERSISGESSMGIPDIEALRALDPSEVPEIYGHKVVCLQGYYEAGDCEPVWYVWDEDSMLYDDNGSVIQGSVELTGRWILVQPTEHCDSRHFGIFPQDSVDTEIDHSTRITQLLSYCNAHSVRPFFNGSPSYPYFVYENAAYNSRNPVDVSEGTVFVDRGTRNVFYGEWNGNPYFYNAKTVVNSATVRNSWHFMSYGPDTAYYIVDSDSAPVLLEGMSVKLEVSPASGSQFVDCEIESNEKIAGRVVMQDITVKSDWFADGYDWDDLSVYGCNILLKNFDSADTYVLLKNKQNESDYGDLGEQEVHGAVFLDNAIVENFSGTATCRGNAEIHNAGATITFGGSNPTLNAIDSWLTVVMAGGPFDTLAIRRGQIASASTVSVLTAARLDDVDIDAPLSILGGRLDCTGCRINKAISHVGDPVVENVLGCVFNAQLQVRGGGTDVVVNAVWQGNVGNVENPISIDKTNLALLDSAHSYKYSGNSGTFLPSDRAKFTRTLTFTDSFTTATQNDDYVMLTEDSTDAPPSIHFRSDASYENQNPGFNHGFSGTVGMFRVGRDAFPVRVDWRVSSTSAAQMPQLAFNIAPVSFRMLMSNSDGMEWNCYVYKAAYSAQGYNTYDTHIAIGLLNFAALTDVSITGAFEAVR